MFLSFVVMQLPLAATSGRPFAREPPLPRAAWRTASGCNAIQREAASSDRKNRDCSQKVPRTQSHRSAGRMSDKTLVAGKRSVIPSGVATNVTGWPDAEHSDRTCASSASSGGNRTVSNAHQVKRGRSCRRKWCWVGTSVIPQPTMWPCASNSVSGTRARWAVRFSWLICKRLARWTGASGCPVSAMARMICRQATCLSYNQGGRPDE